MGYGRNPETVRAILPVLGDLAQGKPWAWSVEAGTAHLWSYKIHEALYIATLHPTMFPGLAEARKKLKLVIVSPTRLEAVPRNQLTTPVAVERTEDVPAPTVLRTTPVHGTETHSKPVPKVGLYLAEQIAASWLAQQPSNDNIVFTNTRLTQDELVKLHRWCNGRTPKLMFFVSDIEKTLTLGLVEIDALEFSWHPPKVDTPPVEVLDL